MKELLEKILGVPVKDVIKLHGDASYRAYFRAHLTDGATRIIMQMPAGKSSVSEEITNFKGSHKELPFINVEKFLDSLKLPVPKIISYSEADRVMILEDIGDGLLSKFVKDAGDDTRRQWYKKAIDLLVTLQERTAKADVNACVAMQRSFDPYLLNWEFDHFREYLVEARNGVPMEKGDRLLFEEATRRITDDILKIPYGFTHRDFQSRNLMVRDDGSLAIIDFQDALMGPCVYDLVALLRDSYVELEWETVEELIGYYHDSSTIKADVATVQRWFNLVTLQRKMKDAGRFVFIDRVKKNPNFLQFIPSSLDYVKNAFEKIGDDNASRLFEMLTRYVPEWRA